MNTYTGRRRKDGAAVVYKNGEVLTPCRSLRVWNHSPTGFEWGYGGSGPAQLALALLLEETTHEQAIAYHQRFKWEVIAEIPPRAVWEIDGACIADWLREKTSTTPDPPTVVADMGSAAAGVPEPAGTVSPAGSTPDGLECVDAQA